VQGVRNWHLANKQQCHRNHMVIHSLYLFLVCMVLVRKKRINSSDRTQQICQRSKHRTQLRNECHDDEQETVQLTRSNMLKRTNVSDDTGNDDENDNQFRQCCIASAAFWLCFSSSALSHINRWYVNNSRCGQCNVTECILSRSSDSRENSETAGGVAARQ